MMKRWAAFLVTVLLAQASPATESLDKLANDFWAWRAKYAPFTGDDVNRLERPGGTRDWSRASIEKQRKDLAEFEARWKKLDPAQVGDSAAGGLPSDRFRFGPGALGTGH